MSDRYCSLYIDDQEITSCMVFYRSPVFLELFDTTTELVVDIVYDEECGYEHIRIRCISSTRIILDRLLMLGINEHVGRFLETYYDDEYGDYDHESLDNTNIPYGFTYNGDLWKIYYAINCKYNKLDMPVILDVTESFFKSGEGDDDVSWEEGDGVQDIEKAKVVSDIIERMKIYTLATGRKPTVVITEGSTDIRILRHSLAVRYPHLTNYIQFIDFDTSKVAGGASEIIKALKVIIGIDSIDKQIVVLLDNDTASKEAKSVLSKIDIPPYISVLHYPDIPTIGPTGKTICNINGLAGSIEMYLGTDILSNGDGLIPIRWQSYNKSLNSYYGEISVDKSKLIDKFIDKCQICINDPQLINKYD